MRRSVEHLGPQHELLDILVTPDTVMRVCPEFEIRRFVFMRDLIASHGALFPSAPFDDRYPKYSLGGRCYDQAMDVAINCNLIYCEGVMLANPHGKVLPMPHAWCCDAAGKLIDPTGHALQHKEGLHYWGIKFKTSYALAWHKRFGFHGLLDGHPELGDSVGVYADPVSDWCIPVGGGTR